MTGALGATALVALGMGVGALLLLGVGSAVTTLVDPDAPMPLSTRVWLGVAGTFAILQPLHLVLPVADAARALVACLAVAGLWAQRAQLAALARGLRPWERAALALGLVMVARLALGPGPEGDSLLYHYPAVRLAASFPEVPGVANLNPFLGYNHGGFILIALFDAGPFAHKAQHLLNPLLVLVTGARCLREAAGLARPATPLRAVVATVALVPVLATLSGIWLVSASASVGETLFVTLLALEFLTLLEDPARPSWAVALLAAGAIVFKLSAAPIAGALLVVAAARAGGLSWRARLSTAVVALSAVIGWVAAGAVRTGYLMYPMAFAPLPVDWRMDPEVPTSIVRYTAAYTRGTFHRLYAGEDDGAWWGPWLERALLDNALLVPALASVVCVALALTRPRARRRLGWLLPTTLALVAWFFAYPDTQYLGAVLMVHTGIALALLVEGRTRAWGMPITMGLVALLVAVTPGAALPRLPPAELGAMPVEPTAERLIDGGPVGVAVRGLDCGDALPPCTGLVEPTLRFRVSGEVRWGFTVRDASGALEPGGGPRWRLDREFLLGDP